MTEILIRCPITGKDLSTGLDLIPEAFEKADLRNRSVGCPHCGQIHSWSREDAYFRTPPERESGSMS